MLGVFLDIETNGLDLFEHRPIDIALQIVDLHTGEEKASYTTIVKQSIEVWEKSDLSSLEVNGFTFEMVKEGREEKEIGEQVEHLFLQYEIKRTKAVFICQNPSFDRVFFSKIIPPYTQELLQWPYHWLDLASMFWAIYLHTAKNEESSFPWEIGFSKDRIANSLDIPAEKKPHRAMNGVSHLILCYEKLVGFPFKKASVSYKN